MSDICCVRSALGTLKIESEEGAIVRVDWIKRPIKDSGTLKHNKKIRRVIESFFSGKADALDGLTIQWPEGSAFQKKVLKQLCNVPAGQTISYGQLAKKAGSPRAARAVGSAMARNPMPLLIPCHRVLKSDGTLGNYSGLGGAPLKQRLLNFEAKIAQQK